MSEKSLSKGASQAAPQIRKCGQCGGRLAPVRSSASSAQFRCQDCGAKFAFKHAPVTPVSGSHEKREQRDQRMRRFWENTLQGTENPGQSIRPEAIPPPAGTASAIPTAANLPKHTIATNDAAAGVDSPLQILNKLNEGGMGVIYRARQQSLHREIALKQMRGGALAQNPENVGQFLSEAYATGMLDHPNIVPVHELGCDQKGTVFYTMKLIQGQPWKKQLYGSAEGGKNDAKTMQDHLEILLKVCDAIAFAHSRGIIHRDLKPENVMVGEFGEVLVVDWGLAATVQRSGTSEALLPYAKAISTPGGTPHYMPPEMALGIGEQIGAASDVYLLGSILFEVLFRRTPHQGESVWMVLSAAANNEIQFPEVMGGDVRAYYQVFSKTLNRALATKPESRYGNATAFATDLREDLQHYESVRMAATSNEALRSLTARGTGEQKGGGNNAYFQYAEVIAGLKQALASWPENRLAQEWLQEAHIQYAQAALAAGDLGLAQAQVEEAEKGSTEQAASSLMTALREQIGAAQEGHRQQTLKATRLKWIQIAAVSALGALLIVIGIALVMVNSERSLAEAARSEAESQGNEAKKQSMEALRQKSIADTRLVEVGQQRTEALRQKTIADTRLVEVGQQKAEAEQHRAEALKQEQAAIVALDQAKGELYAGNVRLANRYLLENNITTADQLLDACDPKFRNWEWHWTRSLAHDEEYGFPCKGFQLAVSPDGRWCVGFSSKNGVCQLISTESKTTVKIIRLAITSPTISFGKDTFCIAGIPIEKGKPWRFYFSLQTGEEVTVDPAAFDAEAKQPLQTRYRTGKYTVKITNGIQAEGDALVRNQIHLVDVADNTKSLILSTDGSGKNTVRTYAINADGTRLAVSLHDGGIWLWDISKFDHPVFLGSLRGNTGFAWDLQFLPDNQTLVSFAYDGTFKAWSSDGTPRDIRKLPVPGGMMTGLSETLTNRQIGLLDSSQLIIVGTRGIMTSRLDGDPAGQGLLLACSDNSTGNSICRFDWNGVRFLFTSDKDLLEFDMKEKCVRPLPVLNPAWTITALAQSRDGKYVAIGKADGTIELQRPSGACELSGHKCHILSMTFSADHSVLMSGSYGDFPNLNVWDVKSGTLIKRMDAHGWGADIGVSACRASPDGSILATAGCDNIIRLWKMNNWDSPIGVLNGHTWNVSDCEFSHDGSRLVSIAEDKKLKLWDVSRQRELLSIDTDGIGVECLFSADDSTLITYEKGAGLILRQPHLYPIVAGAQTPPPPDIKGATDTDIQKRCDAIFSFRYAGPDLLLRIEKALDDPSWMVRNSAVFSLQANTPAGLKLLEKAIADSNPHVRSHAQFALRTGDDSALALVEKGMGDPDAQVRCAATRTLAFVGRGRSLPILEKAVKDSDSSVRASVSYALVFIRGVQVMALFEHLLADPDPEVRRSAAKGLGENWDEEAVRDKRLGLLTQAMRDVEVKVRLQAARSLAVSKFGTAIVQLTLRLKQEKDPATYAAIYKLIQGMYNSPESAQAQLQGVPATLPP